MAQPGRKRRDEEQVLTPEIEEVSAVEEIEEQETEPATLRDEKGYDEKGVALVLVGAGSYTSPGNGLGVIRKGHPFEADAATAKELLRTGLFREA